MPETVFDFAIFGSTPFAGLLAGLLARDHGKRVLRVGRRVSPQRLPRRLEMALTLASRPHTWKVLRDADAEIRRLLPSLGAASALSLADVEVRADTEATAIALAHAAHLALAHGMQVRQTRAGWIFRDVTTLGAEALEVALAAWLTALGVGAAEPDEATISFARGGAAELATVSGPIVLADDAALVDLLPDDARSDRLLVHSLTATLTSATRRLPAAVVHFPDRGVRLVQRGGAVLGLVDGDADVEARLASTLAPPFPIRRVATGRSRRMLTGDGAPLIGVVKPSRLFVVAGLGDAETFFAPAVARLLAGVAPDEEKRWFAAHDPARQSRVAVADFNAAAEVAP
ncbi:MAG TPA: hypothetical protein VHZ56_06495 [Devosia sp.]|nr:hypothetical protein [Devosia sp.]